MADGWKRCVMLQVLFQTSLEKGIDLFATDSQSPFIFCTFGRIPMQMPELYG